MVKQSKVLKIEEPRIHMDLPEGQLPEHLQDEDSFDFNEVIDQSFEA